MYTYEYENALNLFNDFFKKVVKDIEENNRKIIEMHLKSNIPIESYRELLQDKHIAEGKYIIPVDRFFELSNEEVKSLERVIANLYHGNINRCKIRKMLFKKAYKVTCYHTLI